MNLDFDPEKIFIEAISFAAAYHKLTRSFPHASSFELADIQISNGFKRYEFSVTYLQDNESIVNDLLPQEPEI